VTDQTAVRRSETESTATGVLVLAAPPAGHFATPTYVSIRAYVIFIRRNRSCNASDFAYSYTFLSSVVCRLSIVCHICAPCLNRLTDL